ncbi:MAG: PEP-utilizing enzyme, partial [Myxococcota bacterium]
KDVQVVLTEEDEESVQRPVPEDLRRVPALSEALAARLAGMARRLEVALGRPQDIEWTRKGDALIILQARPITQPIPRGRRLLWDNSNIIESYYGPVGPLTYSFASRAYTIVYQLFCEVMGVPRDVIRDHSAVFPRMIGLIRGRIYYNLNAWYTVVSLLPGYRWNRAFLEQMMGVSEVASDQDVASEGVFSRLADLPRLVWLSGRLLWRSWRLDADVRSFHSTFEEAVSKATAQPLAERSPHQLVELYAELERKLLWAWATPIVNDFFVMIFHGLLRALCQRWIPDEADLHNALLSGEGGIISTAPATEAVRLANQVRTDAKLTAQFLSDVPDEDLLEPIRAHPRVGPMFAAYIERLGDRCADELKLEVETYRHRPELLVRTLRSYLLGDPARLRQPPEEHSAVRVRAETIVVASLDSWRARVFAAVLVRARRRVADRENLRFLRTRIFAMVREIFRTMGERMVARGAIDHRQDVFWLTVDEVLGWVRGTAVTTNLRGLVVLRREEYDGFARLPPPADRFHTWGPIWADNAFLGRPEKMDLTAAEDGILRGLPACPGHVDGVVRCITDPRTQTLQAGEIMAAYRTDPGWTPLFPRASAILVERGSLLSHSAVVAREMGIPTVVGIPRLMERLKTGDRVVVDAVNGTVAVRAEGDVA